LYSGENCSDEFEEGLHIYICYSKKYLKTKSY